MTATTEVRHFRKLFGTSVHIIKILWDLLLRDSVLSSQMVDARSICFVPSLKVYSKQSLG